MGGGVIQLIVYGSQDIYLTGEPQITFFKAVYKRYTNFAIESIPQNFLGSANFENTISVPIQRNGDLLKNIWLQYSPKNILSGMSGYTVAPNIGHTFIDTIDFLIGGQLVDRHYGKWLTIWNYLTEPNPTGEQGAIDNWATGPGERTTNPIFGPAGNGDNSVVESNPRATRYNRMSYNHRAQINVKSNEGAAQTAWIPLQFWFCKNPGLAIPLIALQYHEIKFYIQFNPMALVRTGTTLTGNEFSRFNVYADFVYLDTTERRQFAQNAHEYLVEQLQIQESISSINVKLAFNHPVKELIWAPIPLPVSGTTRNTVIPGGASPNSGFTLSTFSQPNTYKLVLNGAERFSARDITYFTRNQVWEAHSGYGSVLFPDSIGVYSFALRPEEYQPSGTCNFSRIESSHLVRSITYTNINGVLVPSPDVIDIYAINYNILRVNSGMCGLVYSN